jgi:hypothetical protein
MGGTLEAYQVAASVREYLDSLGYKKTQVILLNQNKDELHQNFGKAV